MYSSQVLRGKIKFDEIKHHIFRHVSAVCVCAYKYHLYENRLVRFL